ncbi:MAG: NAD-dependent epimerase/dehydratase family protein [Pseudomonadota bacterium]
MVDTLIIGCGYVGRRLLSALEPAPGPVTALVRSHKSAEALHQAGVKVVRADLDQAPLPPLPLADARVFYLAPPPSNGTEDGHMARFLAACALQGQPERILYFSTTGVYGDCGGAWVDEDRPPAPRADRARRRLDAENQLRSWRNGEVVILRVAGIYGPQRLPLQRLREGLPLLKEAQAPFTNRIHVDDLVGVALAAMERGADGGLYNACDGNPSTMNDYFRRLADLSGLPRPPEVDRNEAAATLSPGMLSYLLESRRLSNRRLREELGVRLRYPTLADGLPACLSEGLQDPPGGRPAR